MDPSGNNGQAAAIWSSTMWWLCGVDAVLPIGDIIYWGGVVASVVVDAVTYVGVDNVAAVADGIMHSDQAAQQVKDLIDNTTSNDTSPGDPNNKPNFQKANDSYLKKNNIDAHKLKQDILGKKADISKYDIYMDKNTKELYVFQKGGVGSGIPTGEFIK